MKNVMNAPRREHNAYVSYALISKIIEETESFSSGEFATLIAELIRVFAEKRHKRSKVVKNSILYAVEAVLNG